MPTVHELKTWPNEFQAVFEGRKPFELRRNDRDYHVGDRLVLREYNPATHEYTGRACGRDVVCIIEGGQFGLQDDYVAMGLDMSDSPVVGSTAVRAIITERRRQVEAEGYSPDHDDKYLAGELALAAAAYAIYSAFRRCTGLAGTDLGILAVKIWPWASQFWKPKDNVRDLVRAGALIVGDLEALERQTLKARADRTQGAL